MYLIDKGIFTLNVILMLKTNNKTRNNQEIKKRRCQIQKKSSSIRARIKFPPVYSTSIVIVYCTILVLVIVRAIMNLNSNENKITQNTKRDTIM